MRLHLSGSISDRVIPDGKCDAARMCVVKNKTDSLFTGLSVLFLLIIMSTLLLPGC